MPAVAAASPAIRAYVPTPPATAPARLLAKTGLQSVATSTAINLNRLAAWFAERPLASTRVSRFAATAA